MRKQLLTLFLLLSTATFSSLSFGDWELAAATADGDMIYWDKDRVRVSGGLVYYYFLQSLLKPSAGTFSRIVYAEGNCQRMSTTHLSYSFYKQALGEGVAETLNPPNPDITYPEPGTVANSILSAVCDYVNSN